jgi:60 kDa SS-A/Ro ribonucleoprotein
MPKFNQTHKPAKPDAVTYEGGLAFEKSLEQDWLNNLFSNMLENRFYETGSEQMERYITLTKQMLAKYGPGFVARASYFARNTLGMRSISQLTAAMLNSQNFDGKRNFYAKYMKRPDDVSEIFAILDALGEKRSHALVRGAADYLSSLNAYTIDKYAMRNKDWSMIDLINVCHPKSAVVDKFYNGQLEHAGTWEQKISASKSEDEKSQNWRELVEGGKLGYLALIRNLNNILAANVSEDWIEQYLVPQLTNKDKIHKSLVFPYQIYTAYKNLNARQLDTIFALNRAFRTSVDNIPGLDGRSLVVLDVSGSMEDRVSGNSNMTIKEVCACYAAAIYLANLDSDFIKFGTEAKFRKYNRLNNVFDIIREMQYNDGCGYGTNIVPVFLMLKKHYDRIFLFSDMQVMSDNRYYSNSMAAQDAMKEYFKDYGRTKIYSIDMGNYRTQIANPMRGDLTLLTGFSDKVFKFISLMESGVSIIDYINFIPIG